MTNSESILTGFALWLMPTQKTCSIFNERIQSLRKRIPDAPSVHIPAHMTLLSGLKGSQDSICKIAEALRKQCAPLRNVSFSSIHYGESFFQCVFALADDDDDDKRDGIQSMRYILRLLANDADVTCTSPALFPHVSLVYSDMTTVERAQVASIEQESWPEDIKCDFDEIHVYATTGPCDQWTCISKGKLCDKNSN